MTIKGKRGNPLFCQHPKDDAFCGHSLPCPWHVQPNRPSEQPPPPPTPVGAAEQVAHKLRVLAASHPEAPAYAKVLTDGAALLDQHAAMAAKLREIADLKPQPYDFPSGWWAQIAACAECKRYEGHPIQQGICDTHRRPLWDREKHGAFEERALGSRAITIARAALAANGGVGIGEVSDTCITILCVLCHRTVIPGPEVRRVVNSPVYCGREDCPMAASRKEGA